MLSPDRDAIRRDLEFMTHRWHELPKPAKLELRSFHGRSKPRWAQFTVARLNEAIEWAFTENEANRNTYALRNPIRMDQNGSASDADILAAFFCWADCDDAEATDNVRKFSGPKWTAAVTTGRTPNKRVHLYFELAEPVYNLGAWRDLQSAIASNLKSDPSVINPSRIMRIGGTIAYPDEKKVARGYVSEMCTIRTQYEDDREPIEFERLLRVFPQVSRSSQTTSQATLDGGGAFFLDVGDADFKPSLDRALVAANILGDNNWRNNVKSLVCSYVARGWTNDEIIARCDPFTLPGYTVADTRKDVVSFISWARKQETINGGAYGTSPDAANVNGTIAVTAEFDGDDEEGPRKGRNADPVDIWGCFPAPALPMGLLPKVIEDFAIIQGKQMGCDPGGLAAAALCVCCAAISDDIKVRVKRYEEWHESARVWVALVGDPSTKKSPVLSAAERPLREIDRRLYKDFIKRRIEYDSLKKEEKAETERPQQKRRRLEDTTIEAAQEVLVDSPDGVLITQDELSGWFGGMDRYGAGKGGKDRAFWLQSFNGGHYAYNRIGRGAGMIDNLSVCVLGGIQPEPIRAIVSDAHDDGLIQRLFPIVLKPATLGDDDPPPSNAMKAYSDTILALTRAEIAAYDGYIDTGDPKRLAFSPEANEVRREMEKKHLNMMSIELVNRKLAAHIGKYDGLFARLCVCFHALENIEFGALPMTISEDTARRVGEFLHRFLFRHAVTFYSGILALSDDHDQLTAVAGYILAHKLETVSARDVARGGRTMRKLTRPEVVRIFEQLEALGWVSQQPTPARVNAAPTWNINPEVHSLFALKAGEEVARREEVAKLFADLSKGESD
jgi:hypothetical protein